MVDNQGLTLSQQQGGYGFLQGVPRQEYNRQQQIKKQQYEEQKRQYEEQVRQQQAEQQAREQAQADYNKEVGEWKTAEILVKRGDAYLASMNPSLMDKIRVLWKEGMVSDDKIIEARNRNEAIQKSQKTGNLEITYKDAQGNVKTDYLERETRTEIPQTKIQLTPTADVVSTKLLNEPAQFQSKTYATPQEIVNAINQPAPYVTEKPKPILQVEQEQAKGQVERGRHEVLGTISDIYRGSVGLKQTGGAFVSPEETTQSKFGKSNRGMFGDIIKAREQRLADESYIKGLEQSQTLINQYSQESAKMSGELTGAEKSYTLFGDLTGASAKIENVNKAFGWENTSETIKKKQEESYISQTDKLKGDISKLQEDYANGNIKPEDYNKKADEINQKINVLDKRYANYQAKTESFKANLQYNYGVNTNIDEQGKMTFTPQKEYLTVEQLALRDIYKEGVNTKTRLTAQAYMIKQGTFKFAEAYALTYGLGQIGLFGELASGLGKAGSSTLALGFATYSLPTTVIKLSAQEVRAEQLGLPKYSGLTLGITELTGSVAGGILGGYQGTQAYQNRLQQQILEGKYTKTISRRQGTIEMKEGELVKGTAEQNDISQIDIRGTKYKIQLKAQLKGEYAKDMGTSDAYIYGKFIGKKPTGYSDDFLIQGRTLEEAGGSLKARLFFADQKNIYSQDILLRRNIFSEVSKPTTNVVDIGDYAQSIESTGGQTKGIKFFTFGKSLGEPSKIGIIPAPEKAFDSGELFKFLKYKGEEKVFAPYEWGEATPRQISFTKQLIKTSAPSTKIVGGTTYDGVDIQTFDSIGTTRGASPELLKGQIWALNKDKGFITTLLSDKRALTSLTPPSLEFQESVLTSPSNLKEIVTNPINTQFLANFQLKNMLANIYGEQALSSAYISGSSTQLVNLQQPKLNTNLKNQMVQKVNITQLNKLMQVNVPVDSQAPVQNQIQQQIQNQIEQVTETPITNIPMTPFTPTGLTGFAPFVMPSFDLGTGQPRRKKKRRGVMVEKLALLPDFTSRIIGLEPEQVTSKDVFKKLNQMQTGLEVRRGAVLVNKINKQKKYSGSHHVMKQFNKGLKF